MLEIRDRCRLIGEGVKNWTKRRIEAIPCGVAKLISEELQRLANAKDVRGEFWGSDLQVAVKVDKDPQHCLLAVDGWISEDELKRFNRLHHVAERINTG